MTEEEIEDLLKSVQIRMCWIETNTVTHRLTDCHDATNVKPQMLTIDQMRDLVRLQDLSEKLQKKLTEKRGY